MTELAEKEFVEGIFPFSLMIFAYSEEFYPAGDANTSLALLTTPSFDGLPYSSFSPENVISEDASILNDESRNPIIIDEGLAKVQNLSLGDTFTLYSNRALVGMAKEFTVGAIYKRHDEFANYDVVILMNETTNSDLLQLDQAAGYTLAYVKAKNSAALQHYLATEFYPQLSFSNKKEFQTFLTPEEQQSYYETKERHISLIKED